MNILVIDSCSGLLKPESGGQNRFYNLTIGLKSYNQVYALVPRIYKEKGDGFLDGVTYFTTNLGQQTFNVLTDFNPSFIFNLVKILHRTKIDLIHISHPFGLFATRVLVKLLSPQTKIILDAQDVAADLMETIDVGEYSGISELFTRIYIFLVPLMEKIAVNCADYTLAVSKEDKKRFIKKYGLKDRILLVPSGVNIITPVKIRTVENKDSETGILDKDLETGTSGSGQFTIISKSDDAPLGVTSPEQSPSEKPTIFFHGSYFHPPNRKAVELIKDYIAPRIPEANFLMAGYEMPVFSGGNMQSIGFVKDIYSAMTGVDVSIVPIKGGSGTRLKIMDYFMMGLAVVSTKKGIEGIEARNMENAIIVDDVNDDFIDAINYLLKNPEKRIQMGENNIKLVREKYDYKKITQNLHNLYCEILSEDR